MVQLAYPYDLETGEDGRLLVTFPDVLRAGGTGSTEAEARAAAAESLAAVLEGFARAGRLIPVPSAPRPGQRTIAIEAPDPAAP